MSELRERWRELLADECAAMNVGCHAAEAMNAAVERAVDHIEIAEARLKGNWGTHPLSKHVRECADHDWPHRTFWLEVAEALDRAYPQNAAFRGQNANEEAE